MSSSYLIPPFLYGVNNVNLQLIKKFRLRCLSSSIMMIYKVQFLYPRPVLSAILLQLLTRRNHLYICGHKYSYSALQN